jgi:hypothetical protein
MDVYYKCLPKVCVYHHGCFTTCEIGKFGECLPRVFTMGDYVDECG